MQSPFFLAIRKPGPSLVHVAVQRRACAPDTMLPVASRGKSQITPYT